MSSGGRAASGAGGAPNAPPRFAARQDYVDRIGDLEYWGPFIAEILARHGLSEDGAEPVAGINATYPTFLCGTVVVKLFGGFPTWRQSHAAERAAMTKIAAVPAIMAPRLLCEGRLYDDAETPWPYLISSRMKGTAASRAGLSFADRRALAGDLGRLVRRVHALTVPDAARPSDWPAPSVAEAATRSSLPPHLAAQAEAFVAALPSGDPVFVHGDLCANHVFVEDGRLAGVIDWGDAMAADPHYEIIQVHRDLFACDTRLLRTFLEAGGWAPDRDFALRSLAQALHRQAIGLAQHHTMDVFEPVAARFPLHDIATLEELAETLFAA
ncbi:phosphotransferase family protein [Pelagibius sp.]|uniref:phosphotransferase family protein n=1 Tax=Pelagibius sp. TaxID=1931238 RepID=UPI0026272610|nr:aminoglycoside phosphotransferase family protein [Pelagibius sp.]